MAITVTKHKQEEKTVPQTFDVVDVTTLGYEDLADRYGMLEDKVNAVMHNPVFAQFEEVKKELKARLTEYEPTTELEIKGHHWLLDIGASSKNPRKLTEDAVPKLIAMLGIDTFGKIAKVNISDCDKYLTPDQTAEVINEDTGYTGNRKVKASYLG